MTHFRFLNGYGLGEELTLDDPKVRSIIMSNPGCGPCLDFKRYYEDYEKLVPYVGKPLPASVKSSYAGTGKTNYTHTYNIPEVLRNLVGISATYVELKACVSRKCRSCGCRQYKTTPVSGTKPQEAREKVDQYAATSKARAAQAFGYAKEAVLKSKIYNGFVIKPQLDIGKGKLVFDVVNPDDNAVLHEGVGTLEEAKSLIEKRIAETQKAAVAQAQAERVEAQTAPAETAPVAEKKTNWLLWGGVAAGAAILVMNK